MSIERTIAAGSAKGLFEKMDRLDEQLLDDILAKNSNVPMEFVNFLSSVGVGTIGTSNFVIYQGFWGFEDIYDRPAPPELEEVLFFGDDLQGYSLGFDPHNNFKIVQVDPYGDEFYTRYGSFAEFLAELIDRLATQ